MDKSNKGYEIINNLNLLEGMYEIVRVVDPLHKRVIAYEAKYVEYDLPNCYSFWENGKICDNCISMRAYNENKSFVKVEYKKGKTFMILSIPADVDGNRVVVELLTDTTDSMIVEDEDNEATKAYQDKIDSLNSLAFRDALTEVYNRRYINEKLPVDLLNTALANNYLTVIITDIDFFKKINDNYGHLAGDFVLKSFAGTIMGCLKRENDWVARYGGEEFLICLSGARLERGIRIAEEMRLAIERQTITYEGIDIKITASFGVYSTKAGENKSVEDIIGGADQKLYTAKQNGRNRVEF